MATKKLQDKVEAAGAEVAKSKQALGKAAADAGELSGPSPNTHTNLAIADIALRGGSFLARRAVEQMLLGRKYTPTKAKAILKGRSMGETVFHTALARIAMQSVPGAIVVGGGLIAKTLYDRRKARKAKAEGETAIEEMAEQGKDT